MKSSLLSTLSALVVVSACGESSSPSQFVDAAVNDASVNTADAASGDFTKLISRTWSIPAGQEIYRCRRQVVNKDMYVSGFQAISPLGTHHTVLTVSDAGASGDYDCDAGNLDSKMLYASGVGTAPLLFPAGVAIKITAGQRINVNLHLFNTSDQPISGESGISVKEMQQSAVTEEAEMFFAGTQQLNIPSNGMPVIHSGGCTIGKKTTLFATWPHMHQAATHQKATVTRGSMVTTLLDGPYDFNDQKYYPLSIPLALEVGDRINVDCTYVNNTGATIRFGDSSEAEMCFSGMYRYPVNPAGNLFDCTDR